MVSSPDARIIDVTAPGNPALTEHVSVEASRRDRQRNEDLADVERRYYGPEVGAVRRHMNRVTRRHMRIDGDLLDSGSGGPWWKDEMWAGFASVTAAEVDRGALQAIGEAFPDVALWHTANGLINSGRQFDVVLSSSVVGYIHPDQAAPHLAGCYQLLKDGGQLVLTRVLAHGLPSALRRRRLVTVENGSFAYHYTRRDLRGLLADQGFQDIRAVELGIRFPGLPWSFNQTLYKVVPALMGRLLPLLLPFLRIQHMLVATKPVRP
jgi:SAM-dependent methyltransferase